MNLSALASILINIISPIVLVALAGLVLARTLGIDARPLSRIMLYIFTPALVFGSAYRTQLSGEYVTIALFALIVTALMGIVTWGLIKIMRYDRLTASGFALGVLFVNAGNYGLPLILFAYGQEGLARAVVFFTVSAVLTQTLAIFIAARGRASARDALRNVFKMPLVYAVTLGLVFNQIGVVVPDALMKSVDLAGGAAVPLMLTILGIELAGATIQDDRVAIGLATTAKLIFTPLVAFPLAAVMGLQGVARSVCIIEASMPTAVMASIVAVEFDAHPRLVTGIVLASTVFSIGTLTVLLEILK
ncbi:MAG: AEC family transporter [Chloroflexota bacterium]|nr:AEC family transporter [Chloroflexota bacterium]